MGSSSKLKFSFNAAASISLNSTRVSYQGSQVLKASASFSFDRYICGESTSLARDLKRAYNEIFNRGNSARDGSSVEFNTLNEGIYPLASEGQRGSVETSTSGNVTSVSTLNNQNIGSGTVVGTRRV